MAHCQTTATWLLSRDSGICGGHAERVARIGARGEPPGPGRLAEFAAAVLVGVNVLLVVHHAHAVEGRGRAGVKFKLEAAIDARGHVRRVCAGDGRGGDGGSRRTRMWCASAVTCVWWILVGGGWWCGQQGVQTEKTTCTFVRQKPLSGEQYTLAALEKLL